MVYYGIWLQVIQSYTCHIAISFKKKREPYSQPLKCSNFEPNLHPKRGSADLGTVEKSGELKGHDWFQQVVNMFLFVIKMFF